MSTGALEQGACAYKKLQAGNLTDKIADQMSNFLIIQNLAEEQLKNTT